MLTEVGAGFVRQEVHDPDAMAHGGGVGVQGSNRGP
jgi:hypothetical protein